MTVEKLNIAHCVVLYFLNLLRKEIT
uniref:Uncharacterized protein n=1 Tax=Arundo donax TaxID=35708 RepID=A0A0A9BW11_ARUDO